MVVVHTHLGGASLACLCGCACVLTAPAWCAGGLDDAVTEAILHAAFIPFGDIKDINTPLDQATQKHRGFGFITYMEA